jgi:hypothetical protein
VLITGVFLRQPAVALFLTTRFLLVIVIEKKVAKVVEIVVAGVAVPATRRIRTCTTKFVLAVFFLFVSFCEVDCYSFSSSLLYVYNTTLSCRLIKSIT